MRKDEQYQPRRQKRYDAGVDAYPEPSAMSRTGELKTFGKHQHALRPSDDEDLISP